MLSPFSATAWMRCVQNVDFSVRKHPKINNSLPFQQLSTAFQSCTASLPPKHTDRFCWSDPCRGVIRGARRRLQLRQGPVIGLGGRWTDTHVQVTTWGIVTSEAICHARLRWTPWKTYEIFCNVNSSKYFDPSIDIVFMGLWHSRRGHTRRWHGW